MDTTRYILWLGEQTLSGIRYSQFVALAIGAAFCVTAIFNNPYKKRPINIQAMLLWVPILLPVVILMVGGIYRHDYAQNPGTPSRWPQYVVISLFLVHLPIAGYFLYSMPRFRWFASSVSLAQIYLSYWAAFVASMSVTGDWL